MYSKEQAKPISVLCRLVGVSRQKYYRDRWKVEDMQDKAAEVVSLVMGIRRLMPRIGTRKLYYLLEEPLNALGVGRDKLFDVLRANHMLIVPKRQYRQTTN